MMIRKAFDCNDCEFTLILEVICNQIATNYIVQLTGMRNSDLQALGYVQGDAVYGNSVKVGSIKVQFLGGSSSAVDVLMGNLTIFSTT